MNPQPQNAIGPNVKRLIAHTMSMDAIPDVGGFADGVKFLSDISGMKASAKNASEWVKAAIEAIRNAGEPNPWKQSDDETIARELLRLIRIRRNRP